MEKNPKWKSEKLIIHTNVYDIQINWYVIYGGAKIDFMPYQILINLKQEKIQVQKIFYRRMIITVSE